jgi:hypothetical protein
MAKTKKAVVRQQSEFAPHRPTMRDVGRMLMDLHRHMEAQGVVLEGLRRDVKRLQPPDGLSAQDTAEVGAAFGASIDRLARVANDPDNPDARAALKPGRATMTAADQKAALKKQAQELDDITTNIAADIDRLKEKVSTGMNDADVAEVAAGFEAVASRLRAVANDPDNPDPEAPPTV